MTLIRKLALKISNKVVIRASPGSKEWAEGLAREVAFIESDWIALGWSLGSIRVVFDRREVPIRTLDEVPAAFKKFANFSIYLKAGMWWPLVRGPVDGLGLHFAHHEPQRLGARIIVFAFLCTLIAWLIERHRLKQEMTDDILDNAAACALAYKAALRRHCSLIWIPALITASCWVGYALEQGGFRTHPFFSLINVIFALCFVYALRMVQRIFQQRIERLDQLLAEKSGAILMDDAN